MKIYQIIKKLLLPLTQYPIPLLISIIGGIFYGVYWSGLALILKTIINKLSDGDRRGFLIYLSILALIMICKNISGITSRLYVFKLTNSLQGSLYMQYLILYVLSNNNLSEDLGLGKSNSIITRGVNNRVNIISDIPQNLLSIIIALISVSIIVAQNTNILWLIIVIISFILSIVLSQYGNKKIQYWRQQRRELYNITDRHAIKLIGSKIEILHSNNSQIEGEKFLNYSQKVYSIFKKEIIGMLMSFDIQIFVVDLMRLGLVFYVAQKIYLGDTKIGDLTLIWMLFNTLSRNIEKLNAYISNFHQQRVHVDRLRKTFNKKSEILGYSTGSHFLPSSGSIDIKSIDYEYQPGQPVFSNFSLSIPGGSRIALVGPSGGGKSTLVKLIAGYLHPQSGQILIDNQALPTPENIDSGNHISLQSYYPHIGYLTQEPSVFDGTIWENLTYGLQAYDLGQDNETLLTQIDHIIKLSRCEFIYEFKDGLQTQIGEKGIRLSGGQRQRLAIAKIMLKDPDIILLDEPTSALDSENEELVTQALNELFKGKTVIVIAHRLQTVKNADQILYIDGGKVIESGSHEQLLGMKGKYYKMVELQSGF